MKFDLVFSNPPYNDSIDIKIVNEIVDIADEVIIVHPSTWIFDMKGKTKLFNEFKTKIDNKVKSFEIFNGNNVFNIQLFVPVVITHIDNNIDGDVSVDYFDDKYIASNINQVTKYGTAWSKEISSFYKTIIKFIETSGTVWCNIAKIKDDANLFYCQLADIRGTPNRSKVSNTMLLDDFYTMVQKKYELNYGIRKVDIKTTFAFSTEKEMQNFINYLKTDFARFLLSFYKNSQNLHRGELEIIPWLDFTEEWDDDKLFKKFNVSQELQDYIRDFLPDFHGIRK